jgi:hypothetical protein
VVAIVRANAASAVVYSPGHIITSRGQSSKEIATQHALATAHQRYGANVRLLAASDIDGYCENVRNLSGAEADPYSS